MLKQAPDAIPRGLRGWGSKKDNMEITWEVRHVPYKTLHLVSKIQCFTIQIISYSVKVKIK